VDLAVEIYPESNRLTRFLESISGQGELEIKNTGIQLPPGKQGGNSNIQPSPGKTEEGTAK
jgi:hypothetical protein